MQDLEAATPARPFAVLAVIAAISGFAALAIVVWHSTTPMAWERPVITAFEHRPIPLRDFWIKAFAPGSFALIALALAVWAVTRGQHELAVRGLAGCLGAAALAELVLKPLIDRTSVRVLTAHHQHVVRMSRPMFPSAHVTTAASVAMFAWLILGRRARLIPVLALIPLVVGHSVISRHMHFPADVLGGLLLGPTVVYCVAELWGTGARRAAEISVRDAALAAEDCVRL